MTNSKYKNQYLIYARKSTDDTDNQKNSIDYQISQCHKYAKDNNLTIANYSENGISENGLIKEKHTAFKTSDIKMRSDGSIEYKIDRPKFQKMIQSLISRKYKGIICLCWDRISRNEKDGMLIKHLMDIGVDIRFVQAEYKKTSSGALHMDIDGMFSQHYSRVISEKVKNTFAKLRNEGKCVYMAPVGYLDRASDNKPLDLERAPLVRRLFELYATGEWSISQLAKWANQQGLTTKPTRRKRTREEIMNNVGKENILKTSRPISATIIQNILNNPFYMGKLRINKKSNEYIDGKHKALINISLFNKVQQVLQSKNVSIQYVDKAFFTYRGIIRCTCGRSYTPYAKKGINYYGARCVDGCDNIQKNINETLIDEIVIQTLDKIYFSDEEREEIEKRAHFELDDINEKREKELSDLDIKRKKTFADLNYITKNKISLLRGGAMTIEEINSEQEKLNTELIKIEQIVSAHKETANEMLRFVMNFSELVKRASLYYKYATDTEKREIATEVFSELIIADKKIVELNTKDGFKALFERHAQTKNTSDQRDVLCGSPSSDNPRKMAANYKQRLASSDKHSGSGQVMAYSLDSERPKRISNKIDVIKLVKSLIQTID